MPGTRPGMTEKRKARIGAIIACMCRLRSFRCDGQASQNFVLAGVRFRPSGLRRGSLRSLRIQVSGWLAKP